MKWFKSKRTIVSVEEFCYFDDEKSVNSAQNTRAPILSLSVDWEGFPVYYNFLHHYELPGSKLTVCHQRQHTGYLILRIVTHKLIYILFFKHRDNARNEPS